MPEYRRRKQPCLTSWKRPIVLLESKKELTGGVCLGLNTLGAFLPYMPFHHLLFEKLATDALVLTSGNFAEEPIVIDNDTALETFSTVTDAVLTYNRDIFNRTDDSVTRLIAGKEQGNTPVERVCTLTGEGIAECRRDPCHRR